MRPLPHRRRRAWKRYGIDFSNLSFTKAFITILALIILFYNFYRRSSHHASYEKKSFGFNDDTTIQKTSRIDDQRFKTNLRTGLIIKKESENDFVFPLTVDMDETGNSTSVPKGFARLHNGVLFPRIGFGTAALGHETKVAVELAIAAGYKLFDSAQAREWYREDLVGMAIRDSGIKRNEFVLVSKLHPQYIGYSIAKQRFYDSLRDLQTDYLDLFLLHYPYCPPSVCQQFFPKETWKESWRAMEDLYREGKVKAIGVSNFGEEDMNSLLNHAQIKPHVLEYYSDPFNANFPLQRFCSEHHIAFMAYSSLGTQWSMKGWKNNPVFSNFKLISIADQRNCSVAQVVLSWALSHGQIVIPRSNKKFKIEQNLKSFDCVLTKLDISIIDSLDGSLNEVS